MCAVARPLFPGPRPFFPCKLAQLWPHLVLRRLRLSLPPREFQISECTVVAAVKNRNSCRIQHFNVELYFATVAAHAVDKTVWR